MTCPEEQRLAALRAYRVLDTPKDQRFDYIAELATALFDMPMAAVSLLDRDRQWFKAEVGIGVRETPRAWAFCDHTIREPSGMLVVADAQADARFQSNPLVTDDPGIRFYAGVALHTADGVNLGALCMFDTQPRLLGESQLDKLVLLARMAVGELELVKARYQIAQQQQLLDLAERMSGIGHWGAIKTDFPAHIALADWHGRISRPTARRTVAQ